MAFARMDEHDGHLGLVAITLPDHFGGGAQLAGGAIDGGGGAESAQFKFKDGGRVAMRKGDGIQFTEPVAPTQVIAQLRVLVTEDAPVPELKMAGEE
jgi:hypothetical protein